MLSSFSICKVWFGTDRRTIGHESRQRMLIVKTTSQMKKIDPGNEAETSGVNDGDPNFKAKAGGCKSELNQEYTDWSLDKIKERYDIIVK